jgi:hypothetical protein
MGFGWLAPKVPMARNWDYGQRASSGVGNLGEVYDRTIGRGSKLDIPHGLNQLWNAGGISTRRRSANPMLTVESRHRLYVSFIV